MEQHSAAAPAEPPAGPSGRAAMYFERLSLPWYWWVIGAGVAALICYEVNLAARSAAWAYPIFVVIVVVIGTLLWSMGRGSVGVRDGELFAGNAHLPLDLISRAAAVPAEAKSAAMGRQLDPAAFVYHKYWVKTMVAVVLDDPDDPTPYWLVSTRRPQEILARIPAATTLS